MIIERILQIIATICFALMGIGNLISHNWKFAGINLALCILYAFLYFVK